MLNESDSMSMKTGLAPRREMAQAVAKKVDGTVMTSSPALTPDAINAKSSASLPEAQPIAWRLPRYCAVAFSNSATLGPRTNPCSSQTASIAARISDFIPRYWALRSNNGTFTTAPMVRMTQGSRNETRVCCVAATGAYHTGIATVLTFLRYETR